MVSQTCSSDGEDKKFMQNFGGEISRHVAACMDNQVSEMTGLYQ